MYEKYVFKNELIRSMSLIYYETFRLLIILR